MFNRESEYKWSLSQPPAIPDTFVVRRSATRYTQTYYIDTEHDAFYRRTIYECFGRYPHGKINHTFKTPLSGVVRTELHGVDAQKAWFGAQRVFQPIELFGSTWVLETNPWELAVKHVPRFGWFAELEQNGEQPLPKEVHARARVESRLRVICVPEPRSFAQMLLEGL